MYLQEPGLSSGNLDYTKLDEFPLALFAATFWLDYYKNATGTTLRLDNPILRIFQQKRLFLTWAKFYNADAMLSVYSHFPFTSYPFSSSPTASPVYYASLIVLNKTVRELLNICQDDTSGRWGLTSTQGGHYGSALQAASAGGHDKAVQMLIDAGADVEFYPDALHAASENDHYKVAQMLISTGAVNWEDITGLGGYYDSSDDCLVHKSLFY